MTLTPGSGGTGTPVPAAGDAFTRRSPLVDAYEADPHVPETATVRPYTVTGGRTRSEGDPLPIEALVRATGAASGPVAPEVRSILDLTQQQYLSIAELSAHVHLPVGVVRVLVGDLAAEHLITVHGPTAPQSGYTPATTFSVLESVLNGISAL